MIKIWLHLILASARQFSSFKGSLQSMTHLCWRRGVGGAMWPPPFSWSLPCQCELFLMAGFADASDEKGSSSQDR